MSTPGYDVEFLPNGVFRARNGETAVTVTKGPAVRVRR
jgi:hypothetical protein